MRSLRAVVIVSLISGVAAATPSGKRWATPPVTYQVAASVGNHGTANLNGGVPYATVVTKMQSAFSNWTASKVSGCTTSWNVSYTGVFTDLVGVAAANNDNNRNSVIWLGGAVATDWSHGSGTLGLTTTGWFTNDPGTLVEADMELNNNVTWSDVCTTPPGLAGSYDIESVVLHEAGHFLGLDHTTNQSIAVMYPTVANNFCKNVLAAPDRTDVCTVYPGAAGAQGTPCATVASCGTTPAAQRSCSSAVGVTNKICTITCTSTASCPAGYTCQSASGGGMACLPQVGASDLCKFCSSGGECNSGQCVTDGPPGHFFCSSTCTSTADCGAGYNCLMPAGLCIPTASCTNQCTGTGQSTCTVGYTCISGQCEPTGNVGDHCEQSGFCKQCGICIGTNVEAYCRVCCGGTMSCAGCANGACAANNACTPLNAPATDKVCIPTSGSGICSTCTASPNNCLNGAACIAGRCHTACNPAAPGSCGACLDQGGTNGVCACADEVATKGQTCGVQTGGGFFACQAGLVCTGSPQTCKQPCAIGVPGSCNSGEICELVGGKSVCTADMVGQVCAACSTTAPACAAGLICLANRCYVQCNTNSPGTCSNTPTSCAQQNGDGTGVCVCSDQIKGQDQACQANPIAACQSGLRCVAGFCRSQCDASDPFSCGLGLECKPLTVSGAVVGVYCQIADQGAGGGSGTGGNSGTGGSAGSGGGKGGGTGGTGGGTVTSQGCGCGAGTGELAIWPLMAIVALGLRRRTAQARALTKGGRSNGR